VSWYGKFLVFVALGFALVFSRRTLGPDNTILAVLFVLAVATIFFVSNVFRRRPALKWSATGLTLLVLFTLIWGLGRMVTHPFYGCALDCRNLLKLAQLREALSPLLVADALPAKELQACQYHVWYEGYGIQFSEVSVAYIAANDCEVKIESRIDETPFSMSCAGRLLDQPESVAYLTEQGRKTVLGITAVQAGKVIRRGIGDVVESMVFGECRRRKCLEIYPSFYCGCRRRFAESFCRPLRPGHLPATAILGLAPEELL